MIASELNKVRARTAVARAIKNGRLEKNPCLICGNAKRPHAHHEDYSSPLKITWLCAKCHKFIHSKGFQQSRLEASIDYDPKYGKFYSFLSLRLELGLEELEALSSFDKLGYEQVLRWRKK